MNRGDAYKLLTVRLNELRQVGYAELLGRVGRQAQTETVRVSGEPVVIDVDVCWADQRRGSLRVRATALGPSTWTMERLDEWFVIRPGDADATHRVGGDG